VKKHIKISGGNEMSKKVSYLTDKEIASFKEKYPNVTDEEISELVKLILEKQYTDLAMDTRSSEIEKLRRKALGAMGTKDEMRFSDVEAGMLKASLSDGRNALKEILEATPVEAPRSSDGTATLNQGSKKKHINDSGAN
jgi:hypothetical protein